MELLFLMATSGQEQEQWMPFFSNTPVIEYEITPNRPDCLSIIGMARESAASFGEKITYPSLDFKANDENIKNYSKGIQVESKNCERFVARVAKI